MINHIQEMTAPIMGSLVMTELIDDDPVMLYYMAVNSSRRDNV